ncbi:MarR family transcriptional regulator [Nonomuraea phyllanthi]|uniref:MarR family winged helix-turn-helix transcriptional regulator n=1 Tax=Nonomuraea phyllanthi TaxID=2219224 RepID=UPI001293F0B7|nr:MarR family winged helix-turn-helix transcriptional regulator [Nonomuraea phyllanthi]QFY11968.1 MarR family transcriptional regulator [Nonomuraea phyllanthi]
MTDQTESGYAIGQAIREVLRDSPDVHRALARRLGIGVTDVLALDHVTFSPTPLGVVELGHLLGIRSASATVLVERLVDTGHLVKVPHGQDRRRLSLHPTEHARAEVTAALAPLVAELRGITDALDAPTAAAVLAFLQQVRDALARFAHQPQPSD